MDLEEWEFIPEEGFLEIHDDGEKKIFSRKHLRDSNSSVFNMDYFICPSSKSQKFVDSSPEDSRLPKQLVPLPILLQPNVRKAPDHEAVKEDQIPADINIFPSLITENINETDHEDSVSQVFFKKMKENEFVDMKMDSPKSGSRGVLPQIDAGKFQFEEKDEVYKGETLDIKEEKVISWEESNDDGSNIWKKGLSGIGAICSFGFAAAATICIIVLGSGSRNNQQNDQKLRFDIYADDKRMKEVVDQKASRLNKAISTVRGVPMSRARITVGGYYDGLY